MKYLISIICIVLVNYFSFSQNTTIGRTPEVLKELSGLELLDDETLIGINDSGNEPYLHLMNKDGELIRSVFIEGAQNTDWEDLAKDEHYLYIGDIGNNLNDRKDLCIYKIPLDDLKKDSVQAEKIKISYSEQHAFPPAKDALEFDAEALFYAKGSLWIMSKSRRVPWEGFCFLYEIPTDTGSYNLTRKGSINVGPNGWASDSVTGADLFGDQLYVTTYNRIIQFNFAKNNELVNEWLYKIPSQVESIVVLNDEVLLFGDEASWFGGGNLYELKK